MRSFSNFAAVCWLLFSDATAFYYQQSYLHPLPRQTRLLSDQQGRFSPRPPSSDPEDRLRRKPSPPDDPPDKLFFIKERETLELKWEDFTEFSLREELSSRDLPTDGTKDDLVARLEEDDGRTAAKQFGEWLKTLVTTDFEKGVPSKTIQGAALAAALLGAIAGKGIVTAGVASVGAAYAAILPGAAGNVIRLLGSLSFDAAKATSDLVSKLDKSVLPTAISAIAEQRKLQREKLAQAEAKEQELRRRQKVELASRLLMEARFRYEALDKQKAALKAARQKAELASRSLMEARFRYQALDKQRFALEAARLEEVKRVEIARLEEEARIAEAKRLEEEQLLLRQARLAEEARLEQERIAEELRIEQEARMEQERIAEEERVAEEARLERQRIAEEERLAEEARIEQERLALEAQRAEEARIEQERIAEEIRRAEEARIEQERLAEEARLEEARLEQERLRLAEEARAEQARIAQEERLAEEARVVQARIAEEERLAEIARAKKKLAEDALLAEKEAREAALLEEDEETLPEDDFSDEDWQASIRAAQQSLEAKIANLAEAMADEDEKAEWDAAEKLATSLSDVMDDDGDELDIEALAAAARAAVDSYEELQGEIVKEKLTTRQEWQSKMETDTKVDKLEGYLELTLAKLREECSIRGLPVGGKKADLAIRLEEYDAKREGRIGDDGMDDSKKKADKGDLAAESDWVQMTVVQLKAELSRRGLATYGKKADLVARLESSASEQPRDPISSEQPWQENTELDDFDDVAAAARAAVEMYSNDLSEESDMDPDDYDETELAEAARAAVDMFDMVSDQSYSELEFDGEALAEAARAAVAMFEPDVFTEASPIRSEFSSLEDGDTLDWYGMSTAQLREELSLRGLPTKGKKNDLISALEASQLSVQGQLEDEEEDEFDGEQLARAAREITLRFDPDEEPSDEALMEIEVNEKSAFWEIEESVPESPVVDFSAMTVAELKEELRKRGLSVSGKKVDLIARLSQR